jgi:hypothetical protein
MHEPEVQSEIPVKIRRREDTMEKQLATAAYWIGLVSTVLALIIRGLTVLGIFVFPVSTPGKIPISYRSFLDGAILFFIMAIASSAIVWAKAQKA